MVYTGWLSFGGVELINNGRASAYAEAVGIVVNHSAPDLAASLGDAEYVDPVTDDAVWVDPSLPESGRFYGLAGLEFIGASEGTAIRQWTELLTDGGVPGSRRRKSNELEIRALMFAADDAAMSYGLAWLASALRGSTCALACTGDILCLYTAKPIAPRLVAVTPDGEACGAVLGERDPDWDPITGSTFGPGGDRLMRRLYNVATTGGPEMVSQTQIEDGLMAEVRWFLKAGTPYWYAEPVRVARATGANGPDEPDAYVDTIPNYDPWGWRDDCPQFAPCLDGDPYCVAPPAPPIVPPAPADPCFPNDPRNNPVGQPNAHKFTAGRTIFPVPRGVGPDWFEKVPIIRLYSGDFPIERLTIRWYNNPRGVACGTWLDPCAACAEINVVWLPQWSQITLDGRVERATVDCPGGRNQQEPRVYGASGGPIEWPVFECSKPMCVEIIMDATSVAANMWMEIHMTNRSDVI